VCVGKFFLRKRKDLTTGREDLTTKRKNKTTKRKDLTTKGTERHEENHRCC
jgi:hypothetical protein